MKGPELNESTVRNQEPSKLRQVIPQVFAVGAENLLLVTLGSTFGFTTILIGGLEANKTDISVDRDDISWISCINLIVAPFGCLISGPLATRLGRKRTMQLAMFPCILAWLTFYYSTTPRGLFFALALAGLANGIAEASIVTYAAEVTQPNVRGILSSSLTTAVIIGIFTQFLTGTFTDWRTASLINVVYPAVGFLALLLVPESPYWLAEKGRVKDAEKSLCWLRGWVSPSLVQDELTMICNSVRNLADENRKNKTKSWLAYTKRSFILPFTLIIICFFVGAFGGSSTVQTYSVEIFEEIQTPINIYTAVLYHGLSQLVGTIICIVAIHFTGKRVINFISIAGTGLCYFFCSVYLYLVKFDLLNGDWSWIPTILLIGAACLSHVGIRLLVWIIAGEIFSPKVKSFATGTAVAINYALLAVANKSFLGITDVIGLPGIMLIYFLINLVGLIALYYMLFETEGKTLQDIEKHYAGIRSLKEKSNVRKKENVTLIE